MSTFQNEPTNALAQSIYSGLGQQQRPESPQPATELESVITELASSLCNIESNVGDIAGRVLPPAPNSAGSHGGPISVACTYADKVRSIQARVKRLHEIVSELHAHI